jgi:outer membrane lipoprotein SlyB
MSKFRNAVLATPLMFAIAIVPAVGQQHNNNSAYYNGVRSGAHDDHRQGGIGPGKGALIGAAGGAALGAVFGGGLKGTIVGGAAGAGIGAVIGQAAQNNRNNNYYHPH